MGRWAGAWRTHRGHQEQIVLTKCDKEEVENGKVEMAELVADDGPSVVLLCPVKEAPADSVAREADGPEYLEEEDEEHALVYSVGYERLPEGRYNAVGRAGGAAVGTLAENVGYAPCSRPFAVESEVGRVEERPEGPVDVRIQCQCEGTSGMRLGLRPRGAKGRLTRLWRTVAADMPCDDPCVSSVPRSFKRVQAR